MIYNLIFNYSDNKLNKDKIFEVTDKIIIVFLTIQILSVSFSIALSSTSFGIWAGLWIVQTIYKRKIEIPKNLSKDIKYISIYILLFFITDLVSRIFAVIPDGAYVGLKRFLLYLIFYCMIIKVKEKNILNKIILTVLTVFTLISIYEIFIYIINYSEQVKNVNNIEVRLLSFTYFSTTSEMKMLFFVTFFPLVFVKEKIFIPKIYLIISLSLIFISMYLTQSRNVLLAVIICLIIYGIIVNRKFLIYIAVFTVIVLTILPSQFRNRITSIADPKHPSNESRLIMWNVGWQMFKDHPLIGVGDNEITEVYKMYKTPEFHGEGSHLHSNFMMVLATKGIFGIIFYIALFITLFLKHFKYFNAVVDKEQKYLIFGCILAMISFHISGIFEWNYGDWEILTLLLFIISIPFILIRINSESTQELV
jgi:putative inorganic carbon (hco3(-)) transporter